MAARNTSRTTVDSIQICTVRPNTAAERSAIPISLVISDTIPCEMYVEEIMKAAPSNPQSVSPPYKSMWSRCLSNWSRRRICSSSYERRGQSSKGDPKSCEVSIDIATRSMLEDSNRVGRDLSIFGQERQLPDPFLIYHRTLRNA